MTRALIIWLLLASAALGAQPPFKATVYWPTDNPRLKPDADTPWIKRPGHPPQKVRLSAADSPEIAHNRKEVDQPGSKEALAHAIANWQESEVVVSVVGNSYGRPVVRINAGDKSLGIDLIANGHAWVDTRYSKNKDLLAAQAKAKAERKGLWAKPAIPPWEWRQQSRITTQKPRIFNRR